MRMHRHSLFGIAALAALTAAPLAAADPAMSRHRDLRTPSTDPGDTGVMSIDNGLDSFGAGGASAMNNFNDMDLLIDDGHGKTLPDGGA